MFYTALCASLGSLPPPQLEPLSAGSWSLVWSDEFDAKSCPGGKPDPQKWGFEHGFVRNHEAQWYQPDNAKCGKGTAGDGALTITAERLAHPDPSKGNASYTSSSLTSQGLAEFQYGRWEMRGKIDVRPGSWPAWWMLGTNTKSVGWPRCGEVDMMEFYNGQDRANIMYATSGGGTKWTVKDVPADASFASKWHNWTMVWDPSTLALYLDGAFMVSIKTADAASGAGGAQTFNQKTFMILNQAIGGTSGGDPSKTTFPVTYEVDYVRVFQGGTPPPAPPPPPPPGGKAACAKQCEGKGQVGCCQFDDDGKCTWYDSGWVNGGGSQPGHSAANCRASGTCDGWNDSENCHAKSV